MFIRSGGADPEPDPDPFVLNLLDPYQDPDPLVREVWIRIRLRILLYSSKKSIKNLLPTVFLLLYDFLSLKNDEHVASKSNKQKIIFCCHLEGH
jgi:hypothetical protein